LNRHRLHACVERAQPGHDTVIRIDLENTLRSARVKSHVVGKLYKVQWQLTARSKLLLHAGVKGIAEAIAEERERQQKESDAKCRSNDQGRLTVD